MGQRVAGKPYAPIYVLLWGIMALLWVGFMKAVTSAQEAGDWIREEGVRIPGVTSSSTLVLPDGTYRMYYLSSEGITTATSSDGLTWSSGVSTGIRPNMSPSEAFIRNPAVIQTGTGDYLMIYEGVNSMSPMPGPETVSRFFRATSSDGITFTKQPGLLQDGAVMEPSPEEENFISVPDLIFLDSSTLRLYYVGDAQPSRIFSATSTDLGVTWTKEGEVPISGTINSIVVDPDIIQLPDRTYRLFFANPPAGEQLGHMRIRSALSTDGRNFVQEEGARVVPEASDGVLVDPDVVLISGTTDQYRMYFGETVSFSQPLDLKSALSPQGGGAPITKPFLLSFHACDTATVDCNDPRNHQVYLAESDDGVSWSIVDGWTPYQGSVPDVIRRGETIYVYTPGQVRRFRTDTNTWEDPLPVTLTDPEADSFVDPSLIVDESGQLVLFYLVGIIGQDPAGCAAGETTCIKHFRSATEVAGSDGTDFVADEGDRASVTLFPTASTPDTASDPDIFFDGTTYVLYISRGNSIQVYTSPTLQGTYTLASELPDGFLTQNIGGVGSGLFDTNTSQYWTYVHIPTGAVQRIRRAAHDTLGVPLKESDFVDVVTGESIGLGSSFLVASPGIALNEPGVVPGPDLTGVFTRLTRRGFGPLNLLGFALAVQNNGAAATEGAFGVDLYLSADATFDEDVFLTSLSVSDLLDPGEEVELSGRLRISGSISGQFVLAVVDANGEVVETDEGNNVVAAEIP